MNAENVNTTESAAGADSSPLAGSEIRVQKFGRHYAVVSAQGTILRCRDERIPGGLQLAYTTQRQAEEVAQWIRYNPGTAYSPNDKLTDPAHKTP